MANNKSYTAPVWWIGLVILVKVLLTILILFSFIRLMEVRDELTYDYFRDQIKNQLISQGVLLIILVAEAIIYWRIRSRIIRKDFVWIHIGGLLLAFVMNPIAFIIFSAWQSMANNAGEVGSKIAIASQIRMYVVWAALIIGHICFVLVLIDAFRKQKKEQETPAPDNPDLLNDYA